MKEVKPKMVIKAQQGNRNAYSWLVDFYAPIICTYCYHLYEEPAKAEGIAVNVFVYAYHNLQTYQSNKWRGKFSLWLLSQLVQYAQENTGIHGAFSTP